MKIIKSPVLIVLIVATLSMSWFTYKIIVANQKAMECGEQVRRSDEKMRLLHAIYQHHTTLNASMNGFVAALDTVPARHTSAAGLHDHFSQLRELSASSLQEARADSLQTLMHERLQLDHSIRQAAVTSPEKAIAAMQDTGRVQLLQSIADVHRRLLDGERLLMDRHIANNRFFANKVYNLSLAGSIIALLFVTIGILRFAFEYARAKSAENKLRNSEIKYRRLIEDAEVIMYTTNLAGYFTYISPKVESITGHTNTELQGKHYRLFLDDTTQQELATHYETQVRNQLSSTTKEFRIRRKDGRQIWVEQHATLMWERDQLTGFQCIVKDIDEKKRIQDELRQSQQEQNRIQLLLQSILDNTTTIVFIKDLDGRYLLINKQFEEKYHVTADALIGRNNNELPPPFDVLRDTATDLDVLRMEAPVKLEHNIVYAGKKYYYTTTKFPLRDHEDRVFGVCGISTDISHRIEHEQQLIAAKRSAEAAKRAQETFMANMSHEIRTPMNGIIGMTNLLHQTPLQAQQKEFLDAIKDSANNLLVIINDILDFSKIKSGKMAIEQTNFDIRYVVRKTLYPFVHKAHEKGLELACRVDEAVPSHLLGDPVRLRQVLDNLLSNAIKFTEKGSISLSAGLRTIDDTQATICFEVRDTGIGIPQETIGEVFDSFTQSHAGTDRKYGGTGLGLAICKQLVELQQGHITLESTVSKGTSIRFDIPYTRNLFSAPEQEDVHELPVVSLKGRELLVVEDNIINQKVAIYTLQKAGAKVDVVSNGAEAVDNVKEKEYDCILMDIQMPGMDGYKATALIREMGYTTPIIAMTASAINGEREKCVRAGMTDYISKPFIPEELYRKIQESIIRTARSLQSKAAILEHAEPMTLIDTHYLQALGENNRDFLIDVVEMFRQRSDYLLHEMLDFARKEDWPAVARGSRQLRAELNTIRIVPMIALLLQIEENATNREHTKTIIEDIQEVIKLYEEADDILREEIALRN
ncbi:PAS domain S-box protein [Chitinophaga horti]|uniref:histidine kinase n=1 Tax=Chitinophaga horti TaxID=2920382 RepID=A0ABY6IZ51_9BACT|nr:PAS domain S-box protein [Chitinophaga horti]UYQ92678.1 PAS domain S-box protein [Chitinophaga horti]